MRPPLEIRPEPSDREAEAIAEVLRLREATESSAGRTAWWKRGVRENTDADGDVSADAGRL